jgi:hypothetical protein
MFVPCKMKCLRLDDKDCDNNNYGFLVQGLSFSSEDAYGCQSSRVIPFWEHRHLHELDQNLHR